jgi:hypothetical protein
MNLPKVINDLVTAQNNFDRTAYATCFSETAVVFDEGRTHTGRKSIEQWIDDANKRYKATMKPVDFEEHEHEALLKAEVSGDFPGSPIVMTYQLKIKDGLIQSLQITG